MNCVTVLSMFQDIEAKDVSTDKVKINRIGNAVSIEKLSVRGHLPVQVGHRPEGQPQPMFRKPIEIDKNLLFCERIKHEYELYLADIKTPRYGSLPLSYRGL